MLILSTCHELTIVEDDDEYLYTPPPAPPHNSVQKYQIIFITDIILTDNHRGCVMLNWTIAEPKMVFVRSISDC